MTAVWAAIVAFVSGLVEKVAVTAVASWLKDYPRRGSVLLGLGLLILAAVGIRVWAPWVFDYRPALLVGAASVILVALIIGQEVRVRQVKKLHRQAVADCAGSKEGEKTTTALLAKAQQALDGTFAAAADVMGHFRPHGSRLQLLKARAIRIIRANFDGEVKRVLRFKALEQTHIYEIWFQVDGRAPRVDYLADLGFRVRVTEGRGVGDAVPYVQCENGTHQKRVMLFLLPFLKEGEIREITVEYGWPKMFIGLDGEGGKESFSFDLQRESRGPVPEIEYDFHIDPDLGETDGRMIGAHPPDATFVSDTTGAWPIWKYRARDVPPVKQEFVIRRVVPKKAQKKKGEA